MKPFAAAVAIATLCAMPQTAAAQTGTSPYCLQTAMGTRCMFSTMADCEAAKGRTTYFEQCLTRTDTQGTTGLGQRPRLPAAVLSRPAAGEAGGYRPLGDARYFPLRK